MIINYVINPGRYNNYQEKYVPNIGVPKYKKQILTDRKIEINLNRIVQKFNSPIITQTKK